MSADRDITPGLIEYLQTEWAQLPTRRRPSFPAAQLVLRQLGRWARSTEVPRVWRSTETVGQIVAATGLTDGPVRRALDVLDQLGLVVTVKRGGGRGVDARGSTRLLVLDVETARAQARAVGAPTARADAVNCARSGLQLRALGPSTARAQARDTASSSVTSSARDADADGLDDDDVPAARSIDVRAIWNAAKLAHHEHGEPGHDQ